MSFKRLRIPNADGLLLGARLDFPSDGKPQAFALFAHCFSCSKNLKSVGHISDALTRGGIAVLRFDFTGLGESEGDFSDTNFSSNVADLVTAANWMEQEFVAPSILIGHSLGGAAVLKAAPQIPSIKAVATIGAPSHPSHVSHLFECSLEEIALNGQAEVKIGGRPFTIKQQFVNDLEETSMEEAIRGLKRALIIFHSPVDEIVGIDSASEIYQKARHPKSFVSLDNADHLLTNEEDARYVGTVISAWAQKYAGLEHPDLPDSDDGRVVVHTGAVGYKTEVRAGKHGYVADEPIDVGGTNLGPTPYDYLMTALGSCTSITLRMCADRKKWPLEGITVRLKHDKIHAEDCEACETETGLIDFIEREIELEGDLSDEQRIRLLEIADRCPVHRTLHAEVNVVTRLIDA
jgi:putative redox protein